MAKKKKNGIMDFLTNSNTYMGNRLLHKKMVKQKMQGAESFVVLPSAKRGDGKKKKRIRALSLTIQKLLLKNFNSLRK